MLGRVVQSAGFKADIPAPLGEGPLSWMGSGLKDSERHTNDKLKEGEDSPRGRDIPVQPGKRHPLSLSSRPARRETPTPEQQELHS